MLLLAVFLFINLVLYPQAAALAERAIQNRITEITSVHAMQVLAQTEYGYEDLLCIRYAENGRVASVSVDTVKLNILRFRLANAILAALGGTSVTLSLPITNAAGLLFLSGWGEATVKARCAESLTAGFSSSLTPCGINQTRHALSFEMQIDVTYLLPLFRKTVTVLCSIPAAETVIVGEVPDTFTDISRLTDDVTEFDIDDAVDFGSIVG